MGENLQKSLFITFHCSHSHSLWAIHLAKSDESEVKCHGNGQNENGNTNQHKCGNLAKIMWKCKKKKLYN
jgi:hypothetical protein